MINKISNLKLILGLVLLALIYLAVVYFDSSKSAPLEKQLVSIDTSKVTLLIIETTAEQVKLSKTTDGQWQVDLPSGKKVTAVTSKVNSVLGQLMDIRTDRLAAKDEDKWAEYQVDDTGTKLKVQEGDVLTLDMVVGQSGSTSYIRIAGEVEVYASDDFKGLSSNDNINHYRDNTFVRMETDSIESITFNYPGDSSFQLTNKQGAWTIDDDTPADSVKTIDYFRNLSLKFNDDFALEDGSSLGAQIAKIEFKFSNQAPVFITAFEDLADSVIYQSSINEEAYFSDTALGEEFFIGKSELIISQD